MAVARQSAAAVQPPMKFSVALCTYNGAGYLREQLETIAAQSRPPDELVVCDDGSTDGTLPMLQAFAAVAKFPVRIKVNETRLGSTRNFDQALELCAGEYIAFADQDDVWMSRKLEELEKRLMNGAALAFTDGDIVDKSLQPLGRSVWQAVRFGDQEQSLFKRGRAFEVLLDHNVATGAAMAFRAHFKSLIRPIPDGLFHDGIPVLHDWWTAILIAAVSDISFVNERLFKYRQHEAQQLGVREFQDTAPPGIFASRSSSFQKELGYLSAIHERLSAHTGFQTPARFLDRLRTHIEHLQIRLTLPRRRPRRIAPVARELFSRRYHRYSNGLRSAAKDMLVR
jgi:glycosyltransferase involved in cell wall biosynthesis